MSTSAFDNQEMKINILVTGGAGFIGGACIRSLLKKTKFKIFNLDKLGYASDLTSINNVLAIHGNDMQDRYEFIKGDLTNIDEVKEAIKKSNPDIVIHFAAESHVDRSIDNSGVFIDSNIVGTHNLLNVLLQHYEKLTGWRREGFRFHHVSTDEVFGSLGSEGSFNEDTKYDPRSPYSASKAASDHLVRAWFHTYDFPILLTNCSNNFGPWQFPEKLIPVVVNKALNLEHIPLYGNGLNVRDWLYVEDHIDAILLVLSKGVIGKSYCIGGMGEKSNIEIVNDICSIMDKLKPRKEPYQSLIRKVADRPGHDFRYSIDSSLIQKDLGWIPKFETYEALELTVKWYIQNQEWCSLLSKKSGYKGERIGIK